MIETSIWTQMNADYQDTKHKELTEKIIKITILASDL